MDIYIYLYIIQSYIYIYCIQYTYTYTNIYIYLFEKCAEEPQSYSSKLKEYFHKTIVLVLFIINIHYIVTRKEINYFSQIIYFDNGRNHTFFAEQNNMTTTLLQINA